MSLFDGQVAGLSTSSKSPTPNYPSPSQGTAVPNPYPKADRRTQHPSAHESWAEVAQRGNKRPARSPTPATQPTPRRVHAQAPPDPPGPTLGFVSALQWVHNQHGTQQGSRTYAQVLHSPQQAPAEATNNQSAFGVGDYGDRFTVPVPNEAFAQPGYFGAAQQLNRLDLSGNPNYRPGITDTFMNVNDWVDQPKAPGDRNRPRLDSHLSAQSYASTGSTSFTTTSQSPSTISRTSTRRTRDQMMTGDHRHTCTRCSKGFDTATELNHHIRYHQEHEDKRFACRSCSARFIFFKDLERHERVHNPHAERFYCPHPTCKYAQRGFGREDHRNRHLSTQHRQHSSGPSSQYGC